MVSVFDIKRKIIALRAPDNVSDSVDVETEDMFIEAIFYSFLDKIKFPEKSKPPSCFISFSHGNGMEKLSGMFADWLNIAGVKVWYALRKEDHGNNGGQDILKFEKELLKTDAVLILANQNFYEKWHSDEDTGVKRERDYIKTRWKDESKAKQTIWLNFGGDTNNYIPKGVETESSGRADYRRRQVYHNARNLEDQCKAILEILGRIYFGDQDHFKGYIREFQEKILEFRRTELTSREKQGIRETHNERVPAKDRRIKSILEFTYTKVKMRSTRSTLRSKSESEAERGEKYTKAFEKLKICLHDNALTKVTEKSSLSDLAKAYEEITEMVKSKDYILGEADTLEAYLEFIIQKIRQDGQTDQRQLISALLKLLLQWSHLCAEAEGKFERSLLLLQKVDELAVFSDQTQMSFLRERVNIKRGRVYFRQGDYKRAQDVYETLLENPRIDTLKPEIRYELAKAYIENWEFDDAVRVIEKSRQELRVKAGTPDFSKEDFEATNAKLRVLEAVLAIKEGKFLEATNTINDALEILNTQQGHEEICSESDWLYAKYKLGEAYYYRLCFKKAEACFAEIGQKVEKFPQYADYAVLTQALSRYAMHVIGDSSEDTEAKRDFDDAFSKFIGRKGPLHPEVASFYLDVGGMLEGVDVYLAFEYYQKAWNITQITLGKDSRKIIYINEKMRRLMPAICDSTTILASTHTISRTIKSELEDKPEHEKQDLLVRYIERAIDVGDAQLLLVVWRIIQQSRDDTQMILDALNNSDAGGHTFLDLACIHGYDKIVQFLVLIGADFNGGHAANFRDKYSFGRKKPLLWAIWYGHKRTIRVLLDHGDSVRTYRSDFGQTAVHCACRYGQAEDKAMWILQQIADCQSKLDPGERKRFWELSDKRGWTIAHYAANSGYSNGFFEWLRSFLGEFGVDLDELCEKKDIYNRVISKREGVYCLGNLDPIDWHAIVETRTSSEGGEYVSNPHVLDKSLFTDFLGAVEVGDTEIVKSLMGYFRSNGQVEKIKEDRGIPPHRWSYMHIAAMYGYEDIVELLHECGMTLNEGNEDKLETPLQWAAWHGYVEVVKRLIALEVKKCEGKGRQAEDEAKKSLCAIQNKYEQTPFICAAKGGVLEVIRILGSIGGPDEFAKTDECGWTASHYAHQNAQGEVIKYFDKISSKYSVNKPDIFGRLPQHIPIYNGTVPTLWEKREYVRSLPAIVPHYCEGKILVEDILLGQQAVVICGGNGVGKTALLTQIVHYNKASYEHIYWVSGHSRVTLETSFREIGNQLKIDGSNIPLKLLVKLIYDQLTDETRKSGKNYLLVIDDVAKLDDIDPYLPKQPHIHVLISSLDVPKDRAGYDAKELYGVDESVALRIYEDKCDRGCCQSLQPQGENGRYLKMIFVLLNRFPLGIVLVRGLRELTPDFNPYTCWRQINAEISNIDLSKWRSPPWDTPPSKLRSYTAVFSLILKELEKKDADLAKQAIFILRFSAFCENHWIPFGFLWNYFKIEFGDGSRAKKGIKAAIRFLEKHRFVKQNTNGQLYFHTLFQYASFLLFLNEVSQDTGAGPIELNELLDCMRIEFEKRDPQILQLLWPHVNYIFTTILPLKKGGQDPHTGEQHWKKILDILELVQAQFIERGNYEAAILVVQRLVKWLIDSPLSKQHPLDYLKACNLMAVALIHRGRLEEAERYIEKHANETLKLIQKQEATLDGDKEKKLSREKARYQFVKSDFCIRRWKFDDVERELSHPSLRDMKDDVDIKSKCRLFKGVNGILRHELMVHQDSYAYDEEKALLESVDDQINEFQDIKQLYLLDIKLKKEVFARENEANLLKMIFSYEKQGKSLHPYLGTAYYLWADYSFQKGLYFQAKDKIKKAISIYNNAYQDKMNIFIVRAKLLQAKIHVKLLMHGRFERQKLLLEINRMLMNMQKENLLNKYYLEFVLLYSDVIENPTTRKDFLRCKIRELQLIEEVSESRATREKKALIREFRKYYRQSFGPVTVNVLGSENLKIEDCGEFSDGSYFYQLLQVQERIRVEKDNPEERVTESVSHVYVRGYDLQLMKDDFVNAGLSFGVEIDPAEELDLIIDSVKEKARQCGQSLCFYLDTPPKSGDISQILKSRRIASQASSIIEIRAAEEFVENGPETEVVREYLSDNTIYFSAEVREVGDKLQLLRRCVEKMPIAGAIIVKRCIKYAFSGNGAQYVDSLGEISWEKTGVVQIVIRKTIDRLFSELRNQQCLTVFGQDTTKCVIDCANDVLKRLLCLSPAVGIPKDFVIGSSNDQKGIQLLQYLGLIECVDGYLSVPEILCGSYKLDHEEVSEKPLLWMMSKLTVAFKEAENGHEPCVFPMQWGICVERVLASTETGFKDTKDRLILSFYYAIYCYSRLEVDKAKKRFRLVKEWDTTTPQLNARDQDIQDIKGLSKLFLWMIKINTHQGDPVKFRTGILDRKHKIKEDCIGDKMVEINSISPDTDVWYIVLALLAFFENRSFLKENKFCVTPYCIGMAINRQEYYLTQSQDEGDEIDQVDLLKKALTTDKRLIALLKKEGPIYALSKTEWKRWGDITMDIYSSLIEICYNKCDIQSINDNPDKKSALLHEYNKQHPPNPTDAGPKSDDEKISLMVKLNYEECIRFWMKMKTFFTNKTTDRDYRWITFYTNVNVTEIKEIYKKFLGAAIKVIQRQNDMEKFTEANESCEFILEWFRGVKKKAKTGDLSGLEEEIKEIETLQSSQSERARDSVNVLFK